MVFVTTSFSSADPSMRSIAGPESTPCTAHAMTRAAPFSRSADTVWTSVPAVSTMSSWMMQTRSRTSPTTCITSARPSSERRLSMIARSAPSRLA